MTLCSWWSERDSFSVVDINVEVLLLQVDGQMKLRGSHADRYRTLNTTGESQWLPGQNRNVTYITRLQALQAAVDHQLEQLAKEHPTRKAALISFNNEVVTCQILQYWLWRCRVVWLH